MLEHGVITFSWEGNVLRAQPQGLFNEEGTLAGIRKQQAFVLSSGKACWGQLEIWADGVLGTPEVYAHVASAYQWSKDQGCCAVAIVASNRIQAWLAESFLSGSFKLFPDEDEALSWLNQQVDAEASLPYTKTVATC